MPGRDDYFPRAGYSNGDPHELPVDLAAVQADDALLDLISQPGYRPSDEHDEHDELTRVLAGWRQEIDAEPFSELVDTDTAMAVIRAARRPVPRRNPVFGSIAAAAAVVVIAFSAVGLVAKSAQPGDHLWGVTQVLYGDYARSVETAAAVRTELNEARTALKQGDPERARASLQRVQNQLPAISESEGRNDLTASHRQLEQILNGAPPDGSATSPLAPRFSPSGVPGSRYGSSSSASTEAPDSGDSATRLKPNEPSGSMTRPGITKEQPGSHYPPPGYLDPNSGPSSAGTTTGDHIGAGDATAGGSTTSGTVGKDFSGPADPRRGAGPEVSPPPPNSVPPPKRIGPPHPPGDHLRGNGPGAGPARRAPGCDSIGSERPPYCG
ncbi:MAG: anti-sigma-D factor RsdA [Actinomycetota bacterium]|nr:anti-sigma-D factor RsdA [Actinomycetota bacterium]